MTVPDEGVEAIARAIRDANWPDHEDQIHHPVKDYMIDARAALAAAAPFIAAQAWDEGARAGKSRAMRHMSDEPGLSLNIPNPYRSEQ